MKKALSFFLVLLLLSTMLLPAHAAGTTAFTDVDPSHWGASYISQCYDMGLMVGTSDTTFAPAGTLTVGQAITTAVRIHDYCTGDQTEIVSTGENWYDGYVNAAIQLKIMTKTTFDSYTRPASRAELAGLLGKALPKKHLKAINKIKALPDVDDTTPYSEEIFLLYNAGIITGNDQYGTFSPYQNITRVELSALLCRLADASTRKTFTLFEKPADTTIRSTAFRLVIAGLPVYGVVEINKEYFIPIEILDEENTLPDRLVFVNEYSDRYTLEIDPGNLKDGDAVIAQTYIPTPGLEMGKAEPSATPFYYNDEQLDNALFLLNGRYPMVSLNKIGAKQQGSDFILYPNGAKNVQITFESDLIGDLPAQLKKDTTRKTAIAIHDYLINKLTYDPRYSSWNASDAQLQKVDELWSNAESLYRYENNMTLATGYGVCHNYAELFQAICARLSIPCCMISGVGNGDSHAWNMVYVDGKWLYMDCTFDDPISSKPILRWDYCLVGPDVMAKDHAWRGDDYPMPAEYDPAWEQLDPSKITSADMFRKCLIAQMMQKKTSFSLKPIVSGAYGGTACIYKYDVNFGHLSMSYNRSTNSYDFKVEYWY